MTVGTKVIILAGDDYYIGKTGVIDFIDDNSYWPIYVKFDTPAEDGSKGCPFNLEELAVQEN